MSCLREEHLCAFKNDVTEVRGELVDLTDTAAPRLIPSN